MINNELELMQASSDAEEEAQQLLEKFQQEWLGRRGKVKPQQPVQAPPSPSTMQTPPSNPQVNYG